MCNPGVTGRKLRSPQTWVAGFLVFVGWVWLRTLTASFHSEDGWLLGDWLVHYQDGFVRRGLAGTLFVLAARASHSNPAVLVLCFQVLVSVSFLLLFLGAIGHKQLPLWFVTLLLSPATFLFSIYDASAVVGRKEMLYFLVLSAFVVAVQRGALDRKWSLLWVGLASFGATLSHELFVFYTPYLVGAAILGGRGESAALKAATLACASSFLAFCLLLLFSHPINGNPMCRTLLDLGMSRNICRGVMTWSESGMAQTLSSTVRYASEQNYYWVYLASVGLFVSPFVVYRLSGSGPNISRSFMSIVGVAVLATVPLFLMAVDWGRWINIHCMSMLILSTLLLPNATEGYQRDRGDRRTLLAGMAMLIVYPLAWSIPYCCSPMIGRGAVPLLRDIRSRVSIRSLFRGVSIRPQAVEDSEHRADTGERGPIRVGAARAEN